MSAKGSGPFSAAAWTRQRCWSWGRSKAEPTFGNVVVLSDQRESLTAGARAVIDKWTGSGILLVVTHGANILALTGISPASGEIVVVRSGRGGSSESVGRLILD